VNTLEIPKVVEPQKNLISMGGTHSFRAITEATNIDILFNNKKWGLQNFIEYII
jgi:hypothetical protein